MTYMQIKLHGDNVNEDISTAKLKKYIKQPKYYLKD